MKDLAEIYSVPDFPLPDEVAFFRKQHIEALLTISKLFGGLDSAVGHRLAMLGFSIWEGGHPIFAAPARGKGGQKTNRHEIWQARRTAALGLHAMNESGLTLERATEEAVKVEKIYNGLKRLCEDGNSKVAVQRALISWRKSLQRNKLGNEFVSEEFKTFAHAIYRAAEDLPTDPKQKRKAKLGLREHGMNLLRMAADQAWGMLPADK